MRYVFLTILIIGSIFFFVEFINPAYQNVKYLKNAVTTSDGSLSTAGRIKKERDNLIAKYHSISKSDLDSLNTLLPDSVNNMRLIIQINALANKNNLSVLKSVDYKVDDHKDKNLATQQVVEEVKPYGEFIISFQTSGQYKNFLNFLSDLESNLRLVDVTSVDFSAGDSQSSSSISSYKITLKTYWLKQ